MKNFLHYLLFVMLLIFVFSTNVLAVSSDEDKTKNKCAYGYTKIGKMCQQVTDAYQRDGVYYCLPNSGTLDSASHKCILSYVLEDESGSENENDKEQVLSCGAGYISDGTKCYEILGTANYRDGSYYCDPEIYPGAYLIGTSCVEASVKAAVENNNNNNADSTNNGNNANNENKVDNCNTIPDSIKEYIIQALKLIRWIGLVAMIILGVLDFTKAVASDDQDALKKAWGHFGKRLVAVIILFIIPLLVNLILEIVDIASCSGYY